MPALFFPRNEALGIAIHPAVVSGPGPGIRRSGYVTRLTGLSARISSRCRPARRSLTARLVGCYFYIMKPHALLSRDFERILIRANNWIGDVVLSTPALHCIRLSFPEARLSVVAKPWVIPVLADNPHIDEIIAYDSNNTHKGAVGILRLSQVLRAERYQAAILMQRAFEAALIAYLAGIPVRAGYRTDLRGILLTHPVSLPTDPSLHRVEHDLELLGRLGLETSRKDLVMRIGKAPLERASERLLALGIRTGDRLFGLSPGATNGVLKQWLPEGFGRLAARIACAYDAKGIILGAPHEARLGTSVSKEASVPTLYNLAGETSLEEAIALIAQCGLFVSNDAGLMHVAASLDVPLIAVFGPSDHRVTGPWCARHVLVRKEGIPCSPCLKKDRCPHEHRCMREITADDVFAAVQRAVSAYGFETVEQRVGRLSISEKAVPVRQPPN